MDIVDYKYKCYRAYEKIMSVVSSIETINQYASCMGWIVNVYNTLLNRTPENINYSEFYDLKRLIDKMKETCTNTCMDMLDKINNKNMKTDMIKTKGDKELHLQYHKNLFKDAKKILQGKYAIIPYSENAFMLYHIQYVSDLSRYGYKQVELTGQSILFRKNENESCYEYIYNGMNEHGIGKWELKASLVIDKTIWNKWTSYLGAHFDEPERINILYDDIREHYKFLTGKTIEYATREAIDNENVVSE